MQKISRKYIENIFCQMLAIFLWPQCDNVTIPNFPHFTVQISTLHCLSGQLNHLPTSLALSV